MTEGDAHGKMLAPWEQHCSVISMHRFDYDAPTSLLHRSHSGFLVTCSIKREKSATKEALSILEKYGVSRNSIFDIVGVSDANLATKRRKICLPDEDGYCSGTKSFPPTQFVDLADELPKDQDCPYSEPDSNPESGIALSLVKLTRNGLVLLTFPRELTTIDAVDTVSRIMHSLNTDALKSPVWCHRILPFQGTCRLCEKELRAVVSDLLIQFMNDKKHENGNPIRFAVGFNRRGAEETDGSNISGTKSMDRRTVFQVVGAATKEIVPNSVVDLKSPELCILVESLPVYGIRHGTSIVGVSILSHDLVNTKPRLGIKPLAPGKRGKEM